MTKVWQVTLEDKGMIIECRRLRALLWAVYGPPWLIRLKWRVLDFLEKLFCEHTWDYDEPECVKCGAMSKWES